MVSSDHISFHSSQFWKITAMFCASILELIIVSGNLVEKINSISRRFIRFFLQLNKLSKYSFYQIINFLFWTFRSGECQPNEEIDRLFKWLCSKENDTVRPRTLSVQGRQVHFNRSCGRVLDCSFNELCDRVSYILMIDCCLKSRFYKLIMRIFERFKL